MAPEIIAKKSYSTPVDLWSCGIILYNLLTEGTHPIYTKGDNMAKYRKKLDRNDMQASPGFSK